MKVIIAGTGNMAHFIRQKLEDDARITTVGIYGRNEAAAQQLAKDKLPVYSQIKALITIPADVIILAVSDSAITQLAQQLKGSKAIVVHCSGAYQDENQLTQGCIWPIYSLTKGNNYQEVDIPIAYNGITPSVQNLLKLLAQKLGNAFEVKENEKATLHLCATIANNFVHHLLTITTDIMDNAQLDAQLLEPIVKQTFNNFLQDDMASLQTGAASRGDIETMNRHLAQLQWQQHFQSLYECLSKSIMAHRKLH